MCMPHLTSEVFKRTPLLSGLRMQLYAYVLSELFISNIIMDPKLNNKGIDKKYMR